MGCISVLTKVQDLIQTACLNIQAPRKMSSLEENELIDMRSLNFVSVYAEIWKRKYVSYNENVRTSALCT